MPKLNQQGLAPIILIIILTVVFAGAAGVVYNSKKEIKVRRGGTYETKQIDQSKQSSSTTGSKESNTGARESNKLAKDPFKQENPQMPYFSFFPPDGWNKESGGNYIAPTKDKITEGVAYLSFSPSMSIAVAQKDLANLDEALDFVKDSVKKNSIEITSAKNITLNNTEGYFVEGLVKYGELSRSAIETEIDKEIKNAQKKMIVSEDQIKEDIDTIVKKADVKVIGYVFYQNGYVITFSGRALKEFWNKREPQIKASLDTFKFE